MSLFKHTISDIFLVPTVGIFKETREKYGFISSFVKDNGREINYEDAVYLLFKPNDVDIFQDFIKNERERTRFFIDDYDYEGGYVILVYKLDHQYKKDFDLIRQGKYSKTSSKFQKLFPKTIKIIKNGVTREEISLQYRIFKKTPDLIEFWEKAFGVEFEDDYEVWRGFKEEEEILYIEKIKEDAKQ